MNDVDPTSVPKIRKLELEVKKLRGSDIKWSNPSGNQATHFVNCTQSANVDNLYCDRKNIKNHI
jgi:hypothetical protein